MATILIIDDEKAIRAALRDILEHEKHKVEEAEDGAAGWESQGREFTWCSATSRCPRWTGWKCCRSCKRTMKNYPW